jgi:hypothetical protein
MTGGTVSLKSSNPFDAPLIDPNFLTTETDLVSLLAYLFYNMHKLIIFYF